MRKRSPRHGDAIVATINDGLARRIRIAGERIRLSCLLEVVSRTHPDAVAVVPTGLQDIQAYRELADQGLAQVTVRRAEGAVVVLAATTRVWRKPELKERLLVVKRLARRLDRKVLLVTKRGLARVAARNAAGAA